MDIPRIGPEDSIDEEKNEAEGSVPTDETGRRRLGRTPPPRDTIPLEPPKIFFPSDVSISEHITHDAPDSLIQETLLKKAKSSVLLIVDQRVRESRRKEAPITSKESIPFLDCLQKDLSTQKENTLYEVDRKWSEYSDLSSESLTALKARVTTMIGTIFKELGTWKEAELKGQFVLSAKSLFKSDSASESDLMRLKKQFLGDDTRWDALTDRLLIHLQTGTKMDLDGIQETEALSHVDVLNSVDAKVPPIPETPMISRQNLCRVRDFQLRVLEQASQMRLDRESLRQDLNTVMKAIQEDDDPDTDAQAAFLHYQSIVKVFIVDQLQSQSKVRALYQHLKSYLGRSTATYILTNERASVTFLVRFYHYIQGIFTHYQTLAKALGDQYDCRIKDALETGPKESWRDKLIHLREAAQQLDLHITHCQSLLDLMHATEGRTAICQELREKNRAIQTLVGDTVGAHQWPYDDESLVTFLSKETPAIQALLRLGPDPKPPALHPFMTALMTHQKLQVSSSTDTTIPSDTEEEAPSPLSLDPYVARYAQELYEGTKHYTQLAKDRVKGVPISDVMVTPQSLLSRLPEEDLERRVEVTLDEGMDAPLQDKGGLI
ncbi:hypothetical protein DID77_04335 [Candidatus Marinamargulisbacteria bacterium SCGC AG-439-L15]|nr:hypothetical protein DID77_04335 [Candidatus Marinamargulisbacteria bacterium SCGC AG-439-L15]